MKAFVYAILVLGIALRLSVFFQDRSLFLDEANLARNIVEKTHLDFFKPLDYQQYAPPIFMNIEKGAVQLLGATELAMRLPVLLASLAMLLFFVLLGRQLFTNPIPYLFGFSLLCVNIFFIRYGTEIKQYTMDGLVTLALLYAHLRTFSLSENRSLWWWLLAAVAIWVSMPAVFVLATIGLQHLVKAWRDKSWQQLYAWVLISTFWLLHFGLYYGLILRQDLSKGALMDYHTQYFFPLIPTSVETLNRFFVLWWLFFRTAVGYTVLAQITGIGLFLTGLVWLYAKYRDWLFLLGFPVFLCLLASNLGFYSLIPRLTLFFLPLLLLIISFGFEYWWQRNNRIIQVVLVILCLITVAQQKGLSFLTNRFEIEEIRLVLQEVKADFQENDLLLVSHEAYPAFTFYHQHHAEKEAFDFPNIDRIQWNDHLDAKTNQQIAEYQGIWVVYSHVVSEQHQQQIEQEIAQIKAVQVQRQISRKGAHAYYLIPLR